MIAKLLDHFVWVYWEGTYNSWVYKATNITGPQLVGIKDGKLLARVGFVWFCPNIFKTWTIFGSPRPTACISGIMYEIATFRKSGSMELDRDFMGSHGLHGGTGFMFHGPHGDQL